MNLTAKIAFGISSLAAGLVLLFFPYSENKVAMLRLEQLLRTERGIEEEIAKNCNIVSTTEDSPVERFFLEHFAPPAGRTQESKRCSVQIQSASTHRFFLRTQWLYALELRNEDGNVFVARNYTLEFPRLFALWPLVAFLLALVFGIKPHFGITVGAYVLFLGGMNLIHTTYLSLKSASFALFSDQTFFGLALVLLWLAILKNSKSPVELQRQALVGREKYLNRIFSAFMGLWNPNFFTVLGKMFYPVKSRANRLLSFLDGQVFVTCLSVYLLSFEFRNLGETLERSVFLPRYFSFMVLFLYVFTYWLGRERRQIVIWKIPHFYRALGIALFLEIVSLWEPHLGNLRTLTRVGLALVISQVTEYKRIPWVATFKMFLPWGTMLFVGSFLSVYSQESGITELTLALWDPRIHPTGLVLYTFLAGIVLGFLTGNFSVTFFTLFAFMMKSKGIPTVRAALLDGVLAGSFLSPFSLFNLIPASQFGMNVGELVLFRFQQLLYPLLIGAAIYMVSAVNSISILQPVSFMFLTMLVFAFQLKKHSWNLRTFSLGAHSEQN